MTIITNAYNNLLVVTLLEPVRLRNHRLSFLCNFPVRCYASPSDLNLSMNRGVATSPVPGHTTDSYSVISSFVVGTTRR